MYHSSIKTLPATPGRAQLVCSAPGCTQTHAEHRFWLPIRGKLSGSKPLAVVCSPRCLRAYLKAYRDLVHPQALPILEEQAAQNVAE